MKKTPIYYDNIEEANEVIAQLKKQLAITMKRLNKLRGPSEPHNSKLRRGDE